MKEVVPKLCMTKTISHHLEQERTGSHSHLLTLSDQLQLAFRNGSHPVDVGAETRQDAVQSRVLVPQQALAYTTLRKRVKESLLRT